MTTTTPTNGPARSEAYEYGRTGQPFCPPPPGGLAAWEEAAWVADFHAGREDRAAAEAAPAADPNAAWRANMDAAAGVVRAEDKRLDATNAWGEPLERDTDDRGDRVAVNEFRQAVAADNQAAQDAGYRDGYYNCADERRIYPEGENLHYDHGIALGKAGKDGRPENRFSRQS